MPPAHARGTMLRAYRFFRDMWYFVGPILLGTIADTYGFTVIFYLTAASLVLAAVAYQIFGVETLHTTSEYPEDTRDNI